MFLAAALALAEWMNAFVPQAWVFTFLVAVTAATWLGGRGPGLLTAVLAPVVVDYFLLPPLYSLRIDPAARPYVLPFLLTALAGAWMSSAHKARKEAAAAVWQSEEKTRAILANLPDVSWTVDCDHRIVYISPKVEEFLGYSSEEIIAGGEPFLQAKLHPEDRARLREAMIKLFASGCSFDVELRAEATSGAYVWMNIKALRTREEAGRVYADGLLSDVTRRKQAEIDLEAKTALLEAQLNSTIDGILVIGPNNRRILENRQVMEMYNVPESLQANPDQVPVRKHMLQQMKNAEVHAATVEHLYAHPEATARYEMELKNGTTLEQYSSPVKGRSGEYIGRIWTFRDITERKRAETELEAKSALLEAQLDSTIDGILVIDEKFHRILENPRFAEMFGIPESLLADPDQIPVRRHMLQQMKAPDRFMELLKHLYSHREETSRDEIALKDGKTLELYSAPVNGHAGEYLGRIWTFRDITERKRSEQELKAKTAFFEAQVNSTIDGIVVVDENDRRILINQRLIEFFSVPREILAQPANAPLLEHILGLVKDPDSFLAKIRRLDDDAVETSRDEIELKDGRIFDRYSASVIDKDWNYFGRVYSFREITEHKRRENELRQLSAAVEQSPVSVAITDPNGNMTYVNPRFTQTTGYALEEVVGKNPRILKSGYTTQEAYKTLWNTILQGQEWRGEFRNRKKNGELYWEASTITPIFDGNGKIASFLAVKEDITERRALESELRQAQKLEGIGQLAAGIAHEINTPAQFVTDNLTFLMESWESAAPLLQLYRSTIHSDLCCLKAAIAAEIAASEERCDLNFIVEEIPRAIAQSLDGARRVAAIVRAMKEFSHPDSDAKTSMDLNKGVLSTITVARNEWKYVAEIETELDETLPPVCCYPGEINQAILNLIVNAAHAIRDKTGEKEKGLIAIRTRKADGYAEISVADTGTGIPEHIQHRIDEPFFTTKDVGSGTGQGLAFSHSVVVKKHQGKIWFETEQGRGTTFHIQLPIDGGGAGKGD